MVVGAPFDGEGSSTGSVFVYKEVSEDKWELQGNKITLQEGLQGDAFGYSVDIDEESTLAIGVRVRQFVISEFFVSLQFSSVFNLSITIQHYSRMQL